MGCTHTDIKLHFVLSTLVTFYFLFLHIMAFKVRWAVQNGHSTFITYKINQTLLLCFWVYAQIKIMMHVREALKLRNPKWTLKCIYRRVDELQHYSNFKCIGKKLLSWQEQQNIPLWDAPTPRLHLVYWYHKLKNGDPEQTQN